MALKRKNKQFNKGAILNRGFDYLEETNYSDWLVLTDSDIIFPENFRDLLCNKEKKQGVLYGMKRKFVYTKDILQQYMSTKNQQLLEVFKEQSWIGFCQAFTYEPGKFKCSDDYNADKLDIIFRNENFDEYRQISDNREDILIHLGPHAKNWRGRVTTQFV